MKKLILLLMLFSTPVLAVEPITGAFGFKLGDVFKGFKKEDAERAKKDKYTPGVLNYWFNSDAALKSTGSPSEIYHRMIKEGASPEEAMKVSGHQIKIKFDVTDDFWDFFNVHVTLDKGLIYSISANVWLGFYQCGSQVMNRLEQEVSKKYGPPTESRVLFVDTSTNSPAIANWWIQYKDGKEFRAVRTGCTQVSIPEAYVQFYDLFVKWEDIRKGW